MVFVIDLFCHKHSDSEYPYWGGRLLGTMLQNTYALFSLDLSPYNLILATRTSRK